MSEVALRPCPCGKTPTRLRVARLCGTGTRYALAYGNCCNAWCIAFDAHREQDDSAECYAHAVEAWNATPRK